LPSCHGDHPILRRGATGPSRKSITQSHKGAQVGDGLADHQILHLVGTLVGVQRLAVGEEARDFIIGDYAVVAKQLSRLCDGLSALGGGERLGKRCVSVSQLTFGMQLCLTRDQALRRRDIGEHLGEMILHQLERADGPAELQALLSVFERRLVGAHRASRRHPAA
jgi:hypothetical protein